MNQLIIFQTTDGKTAVMFPVLDCGLTIEQIAQKDVPPGRPYKIVDAKDIPENLDTFNPW